MTKIDELMRLFDRYMASGVSRHRDELRTALEAALKSGELGEADVWHEGTRSFYRAKLIHKLSSEEIDAEPPAQPVPPRLTDEEINHFIKFSSAGSAMRRDGTTSQRIARAIEAAVRKQFGVNDVNHES